MRNARWSAWRSSIARTPSGSARIAGELQLPGRERWREVRLGAPAQVIIEVAAASGLTDCDVDARPWRLRGRPSGA